MSLTGCSGPLVQSAITSNVVQEEAHNAYLLLNIARAHERMPMHFTEVGLVRVAPGGLGIGTPSLGLEVPFGAGPRVRPTISPSVEMSYSVDTKSLVSQDFMRGMMTPVDTKLMVYFANQAWPHAMVLHMFVGSIEVLDKSGKLVYSIHNSPFADTFPWFAYVAKGLAKCQPYLIDEEIPSYYGPTVRGAALYDDVRKMAAMKEAGYTLVPVDSQGKQLSDKDELLAAMKPDNALYRFATMRNEQQLAFIKADRPPSADLVAAEPCKIEQPREGDPVLAAVNQAAEGTTLPEVVRTINKQNEAAADAAANSKRVLKINSEMKVRFVMRSTQSMIYFLGELSRWYKEDNRLLAIPVGSGGSAAMFATECCEKFSDAAIAVKYRSKYYSVFDAYGRKTANPAFRGNDIVSEDRSLQTLALVSLIYGLQNQSGEAPAIRNVRVIP